MTAPLVPTYPTPDLHPPNNVAFGQVIEEYLPYADTEQAPYPPLSNPLVENLEATSKETSEEIHCAPSLLAFIDSRQHGALGTLPESVLHPVKSLLQTYAEKGILVHTGSPCPRQALEHAISNGPHTSVFTPEIGVFICGDMQWRVQDGLIILLPALDAVQTFGEKIKLSCIAAVPQPHQRPHLILDFLEKPDEGMPSVNNTANMEVSPELIQFGRPLTHILQAIWEADPA